MNAHIDIHLTRCDTSQTALAESFTVDHEHVPGDTALNEDLIPNNLSSPSSNVQRLITGSGDIEAREGQSTTHPFKCDQEPLDISTEGNRMDHEHNCTYPAGNSDWVILPVIPEEVPPSGHAVVPAGELTSSTNINDSDAPTIVDPRESSLLRAGTVSSATPLRDEREVDSDDRLNSIRMLHTKLDRVQNADLPRLTDEEDAREDFDHPCDDFLPSLPPSSSPPQLFSSSPCASSQSSGGDVEPSKTVPAVEVECSHDPRGDYVALGYQNDSCLESEELRSHTIAEVAKSQGTDKYCLRMGPTSCIEGSPELSRKRIHDPDESYSSQPIKHPKVDPHLYLPPAPRRATLASQHHQFKKLASPFRPPLKLSMVTDGLAQTVSSRKFELTISATLETSHDKIDLKGFANPLQHKASNPSRPVSQFRSPLVNRVLPADSRAIRLTPALQVLERKLQLLKRAIKVKEDNEEEDLISLAGKWIEAGREVAYDVWDATKDAGDFGGKTTLIHRSHGWESNDRNMPWGWDTNPGNADAESRDVDPSETSYTARQQAAEEDDDVGCNTLGTMLRQLGIAPEIFSWDDDKGAFSD